MIPDSTHAAFKYRPEVDGLRAIAVLPVIFFHAGFDAFRGGFVGVDVFFVISGYLITSIILNDCQAGKFSLATFYERRARRILPALFVVMAACLPLTWLWMLPAQTLAFSRSMLATLAFVPNLYFWSTTQYFANTAEEIPLLHTWSLGVEEQFYLLFPVLVWALWRFGLRAVAVATLALALVSFGLSEWAWRSGKLSSNFFFPITRAWELMVGAMLAVAWREHPVYDRLSLAWCNALSLLGFGALTYAVVAFDSYTPLPGVYALAPAIGTALLIGTVRSDTWAYRLLAHPALVAVGLISYSAYLWHQPLFAFARIRMTTIPQWPVYLALTAVTLILAYLTWRFVEAPFRSARHVSRRALIRTSLAGAACFLAFGLASDWTQGFAFRLPASDVALAAIVNIAAQGDYVNKRFNALGHDFSDSSARKVLVVGDSYAQDVVNAVSESGQLDNVELRTFYVAPTCQLYFGASAVGEFLKPQDRPTCERIRDPAPLKQRLARADVVIFASSWQRWAIDRLPGTLSALGIRAQQQLLVIGPKKVGRIDIRELLREPVERRLLTTQPVSAEILETESLLRARTPAGTFVSMQEAVCGTGPDCRLFTPQGDLISFDGTHLTQAGARFAGPRLLGAPPMAAITNGSR